MLFFLYISLILLSFRFAKSKSVYYLVIIVLFLIFAGNVDNVDRYNYEDRYYNYDNEIIAKLSEPTYTFLMYLFNIVHANFQFFVLFVSLCLFLSINHMIGKFTKHGCFVLFFYMMSEFFFDVIQLRNTLAFSLLIPGIYHLSTNDNRREAIIKYELYVLLATSIHYAFIFYSLFIITRLFSIRQCAILTLVLVFFSGVLLSMLSKYTDGLFVADKIQNVLIESDKHSVNHGIYVRTRILLFETIPYLWLYMTYKSRFSKDRFLTIMAKIAIVIWTTVPLMSITQEFHRLFFVLFLIFFVGYARMIDIKPGIALKSYMAAALSVFVFCYTMYYKMTFVRENVVVPIFTENIIL